MPTPRKPDTRRLARTYTIEVKDEFDGGFTLTFTGETKAKRDFIVQVRMEYDHIPYWLPALRNAWAKEHARRFDRIAAISKLLPTA